MLLIKALLIKTKVRMRLLAGLKLTFFVRNSVQTMVGGSVGGKGHSTFISSFMGGRSEIHKFITPYSLYFYITNQNVLIFPFIQVTKSLLWFMN